MRCAAMYAYSCGEEHAPSEPVRNQNTDEQGTKSTGEFRVVGA